MQLSALKHVVAGIALCGGVVACSDSGPTMAPSETRLSIADAVQARATAAGWFADVAGTAAAIAPDTVASLVVTITGVAYLPADATDETVESAWQSLTLETPATLDLMALPTESSGSIAIASGLVPAGAYRKVRLLTTGGEIVFKGPISLGGAITFDGGTPYTVTIPSGAQTGLKTDITFEVTANQDGTTNAAYLVFDPGTTFLNVTTTGAGAVVLNPVLRAR